MSNWEAYVDDSHEGWMTNTVRILVGRRYTDGRAEVINGDGTVTTIDAGTAYGGGFVVPRDAVEAIVEAVVRWRGNVTDHGTESRVLREWLGEERRRVDALIASLVSPGEGR